MAHNTQPIRNERDRTRRVLSQTFLNDPGALGRVVRAAAPGRGDLVLEVGAGDGRLTRRLAEAAGRVVAYEVDPAFATALAVPENVAVRHQDFLTARPPREPFAVVGNIPYALTAPIVQWCLRAPALTSATLVTQLEYARKRTGDYGRWSRLTVATWPEFHWGLYGRISRRAFRPVPRVDSGILRLSRRPAPLVPGRARAAYRSFVDLGFGGGGGSLHASLRQRYPARKVDGAFRAARLDMSTVVGHVWPEQWLLLFRLLGAPPGLGLAKRGG
ncbi:23S rRNA (adenine(2058)-N(6))-methyltransferase Erm(O) [Phytohabitans houttuyneae]|uniref:23S rRNA (Adenine(2058)-N(6))-methyltransferase Erm(O) n=1 Tax=Phytohabitans houttuyneae TaxID=1076126 RepID=A0A6V8K4Z2_9ACTN|nr:ErmE/ErmH/ErmO/ErmR family 23S rRNA (adenine(2058)-N(6))-methyltransferase [Phytohabitans houttuyneae]GFJ78590.1 23S rRNA (adenine(2058)-N(6))-methyltransferase Erm(O) [Phytohabitans houttuyneae]